MSDEEDEEPVCLDELDEAERLAAVDVCVRTHVEAGELSVQAPHMVEEDVRIIYQGVPRSPGQRPWSLRCNLDMDEERSSEFGEVNLVLELDNRLGLLEIIDDTEYEPTAEEAELLTRVGKKFFKIAMRMLRKHELYEVKLTKDGLLVTIALLDCGIDDWRDEPYEIAALLDDLEPLAEILDGLPNAGLSACRYCNARIDAQAIGTCSNCGAAL